MNRIVMVIWGLVMVGLCTLVFMIGYKEQDREYIKLTKELKSATQAYVKDNRITGKIGDSVIIYIDELKNGQYVGDNDKIDEYCIEGVIYTNSILIDKYDMKINCDNKKTEE